MFRAMLTVPRGFGYYGWRGYLGEIPRVSLGGPRGDHGGNHGGNHGGYHGEIPLGILRGTKGEKFGYNGYNGLTTGKYRGHHWGFGSGWGHREIPRLLNHGLLVYYIIK